MKKLIFLFVLYSCTNVGKKNICNESFNDSSLFYFNEFVKRFGAIEEDDMDSVINYYSLAIRQLKDTINANELSHENKSNCQLEIDLRKEYLIKHKEAILISQHYKHHKYNKDSILKTKN